MKTVTNWTCCLVLLGATSGFCAATAIAPPPGDPVDDVSIERWLFLGDSITQAGLYVDYIETWFLLNDARPPEIIDLGVSSETVSGLSEPDHPFPRPCLHTRLNRVLDRVKPDLVVACYGMNCGIYHPFSEDRFEAYRNGIQRLITKAQVSGARLILLTPPPYAGRVRPRVPPVSGDPYGYKQPFKDYNTVLARYAEWILSLDGRDRVQVIDIRPGLETYMEASYPKEPIHPVAYGHWLMAEAFLDGIGKETDSELLESGRDPLCDDAQWNSLLGLVGEQRETYDRALLNNIGHGNPAVMKRFSMPLDEAREMTKRIDAEIAALVAEMRSPSTDRQDRSPVDETPDRGAR